MDIILYILLFFLFIILLLIIIPIKIVLSSDKGMIDISYGRLFSAGVYFINEDFIFRYKIPFWKKEVDIIYNLAIHEDSKTKESMSRKESSWTFPKGILKRIRTRWKEILKTFQVEKLEINIDSDDYVLNAYLFPVFQFLGYKYNRKLSINFLGVNQIEIRLKNRLIKLMYALWK